MKLTWLGQVGLAIQSGDSLLMTDPYLMDTLSTTSGPQFNRMVPVEEGWLGARPDVIALTHDHGDHLDLPSLHCLVTEEKKVTLMGGENAWQKLRGKFPGTHNYVRMTPGTEWSTPDFHIRAIPACHSDSTALGYLIHAEGLTLCVTGDTLYREQILQAIGEPVDIVFVVMNGMGNNMNYLDAARYAAAVRARVAIPVHWGLFEKFSDDPRLFAREAEALGVTAYIARIYETLDAHRLLEDKK